MKKGLFNLNFLGTVESEMYEKGQRGKGQEKRKKGGGFCHLPLKRKGGFCPMIQKKGGPVSGGGGGGGLISGELMSIHHIRIWAYKSHKCN